MQVSVAPSTIRFHQLFEQQAALRPDHPAVLCQQEELTYAELNARANQLAHYLRTRGAGPERLIPICVDRSAALAIGILGILKAGAAFVPIDPAYPAERIDFMLADTAAPLLVTQAQFVGQLSAGHAQMVALDADGPAIAALSQDNPDVMLNADHLAYVIYTSGSTGKPKGTMLTQQNLSHYVLALQAELQLTPHDRYLHLASIAFSSARRHLLLPLAHGATVVMADEEQRLDPLPLFRLIQARDVTVFDAVPSLQRHCTNALLELEPPQRAALLANKLRLILSASEPLLSDIPQTWRQEFHHPATHIHMFGQTETSGIVALHRLTAADVEGPVKVVPVGRPLANTTIYLLDEQQQPVPAGAAGEIYIRGAGVGRGYWQQPELTAEKFIADCGLRIAESQTNPQSAIRNPQLVRTGDFARQRPDGTLECLGRRDFQVKLRGYRVELGEIEAVLISHPNVRACAVMAREDVPGRKRLVAYVVLRNKQADTIHELRALAQRELPEYMQPAAFVVLDALPLTPNGKTDRQALPVPEEAAFASQDHYVAPRNSREEQIAAIWAGVLGLKRVGIDEDFFALGGHSLLASQVIARVRVACNVELPLRTMFQAPTVAGLAEAVGRFASNEAPAPRLQASARPAAVPLSFAQQRLWFLDQLEGGAATYNLSQVVRWHGALHAETLHRALQIIVARHESLRTSFVATDGKAVQVIAPTAQLEMPVLDLTILLAPQRAAAAERLALACAAEPFDLTQSPLLRVQLLKLSDDEYRLVIVFHHIISDGWSVGVFLQELGSAYQALLRGQEVKLPELPIQYGDYAAWQLQSLQGAALTEQLQYWRQQLTGAPALLELPTDKPRPAVQQYRGAQESRLLPSDLRDELQALSQQAGVTMFMTLLAAFQVLLLRYSQQDQIVVGTPIAGRTQVETENLIGFFVNTLALRGDLSGNPSFQELLQRTRAAALGAYTHQELPFEKLVEELQPERSLSYTPLFQVMFALQNTPRAAMNWGDVQWQSVTLPSTTAKFDLSLDVYEEADGLRAELEYDTDLFTAETARRLLTHWQALLVGIAQNPTQPIHALPLLTAEETQQLVAWNRHTVDVPAACLPQLIEAHAARTPEAMAVGWHNERISYGELNARANQLAHYLRQVGVVPETIVGICVERSIEMLVGLLGILKAGGAYLPLDPNYPSERLAYMLKDADVRVLLTQSNLPSQISNLPSQICLDTDWPTIAQASTTNPTVNITHESLAYVIYTSGSTGKAKGVQVTHGNVVNAFAAWEEAYQLSSLRRHLQMASFSFDVFTGDVTRALGSGATLVLCPTEFLLEPEELYQLLRAEQIAAAEFVPAVLRPLLEYLEDTQQRLDFMRLVIVGSDVWQMDEYRRLKQVCGAQTRVISSYGVTEATIDSSYFEATAEDLRRDGTVPIGRPFANTQIYVRDKQQQPVPIGVPGELYLGGAGVSRGYWQRPELTTAKFIADCGLRIAESQTIPNSEFRIPKLYRTGDLARFRADGTLELLGRADQQVKLRGYRIELGEIEAALARHPAVQECVVIVREDAPGDQRLLAYFIASEDSATAYELRQALKTQLPEYMLPSAFVALAEWPLTPNGKVDRRALPVPEGKRLTRANEYVAPRTPTEEVVAHIWADLLKLERVSIHDNFFELGGHSLLATQIISRLRVALRVEVPLRALFETPTIAGLAAGIVSNRETGRGRQANPIRPVPGLAESPQSCAQQRLWFLDQFAPDSDVYNLPVLLHLDGALDVGLLEQSLNHIIARHQILRTTFALQDGEPVQRIAPTLALPLVTLALSDAATLEMQINELVTAPFDLSRGPLLRAHLLRADATEQYLVFVFHHIISDGWSVNLFLKELGAIYQALQAGHEPRLPELPIQYSDYAAWQQRSLQGERLAELLQYWRQQLTGAPALLELPTDKPRPAVQRSRGAQVSLLLPPEIHEQLKALSQQAGVTMFMTLLAAFQVLLLRYSQQDQIVVGTPIAGRTQVETENLIGFFVNTLALRGDLSGNPSFQELLQRTRAAALGAYTHQELPFEKLVEELQPERSLSYTPLFQVMFALQNTPRVTLPLGDVKLTTIKLPSTTAKFDLSLDVYEEADGLRAWLEYDTDLFTAETAQRWLQQWQMLLAGIIQNPAQPIHALPLTLNGKVNRKALPVAQEMRPAVAAQYVAPRTPTEEAVATIWGTLLKLNRVGVHDNFFDLGGHSLLATKVVARLQERFAVKMPLRTLFEMPTVAAIASALEDLVAAATEEDELAALLAELEEMSEDDAQQLLTAMSY